MATYLISGATGFIGSQLARTLAADGDRAVMLDRRGRSGTDRIAWDPLAGRIDDDALARVRPDIVVNLAGEPIAQRWTEATRRRIRDSRVRATETLAQAIARMPAKPSAMISGSAVGYYGAQRGNEVLDERSSPGADFLAGVVLDWERATAPATAAGIRVVHVRTGVVLGKGGALAKMLLPFRAGVGGRIGSGEQWMSWIAIEDAVRAIVFCARQSAVFGAVNLVAPEPVRNEEFVKSLGAVLHRPTLLPVPALALELLYGQMARDTILASQRVAPKALASFGFSWARERLVDALAAAIRR